MYITVYTVYYTPVIYLIICTAFLTNYFCYNLTNLHSLNKFVGSVCSIFDISLPHVHD